MDNSIDNIIDNKVVKAEMYNFKAWINIVDIPVLKNSFDDLLKSSGYKVLNFIEHKFPNGAYTCLWLLAESHFAIHSFIEENKTYIELSGCNQEMNIKFRSDFNSKFSNLIIND